MTTLPTAPLSPDDRRALPVGVIGAGRFGTALVGALATAGYTDVHLASRDEVRARAAANALSVTHASMTEVVEDCALVFLAVPDGAITGLAESLLWQPGQGVVHASGALGLDVLEAATARGALTGCLHPLQTFPGTTDAVTCAALFRGITCGVEGATVDSAALGDLLAAIASDLGARIVRLEGVDRARYHAAAVLVSNDVVALMAAATRAWSAAGLPEDAAREALSPLLLAASANVARLARAEALTGPIARGDAGTVARHLAALAGDDDLSRVYRALGRELLRLDLGHAPETRAALEALLRD